MVLMVVIGLFVRPSFAIDGTGLPKMTPPEIAARVNWSPQCTEFTIVGYCYCMGIPCAWQVVQYIPTAFVETVRTPGETMVAAADFSQLTLAMGAAFPGHTRQINQHGMDNTFEAHVFSLPEEILRMMTWCMKCQDTYAKMPYIDSSGGVFGGLKAACGAVTSVVSKLGSFSDVGGFGGYGMQMYYAGEADALNWRTGCRDESVIKMLQSNGFTCGASGLAEYLGGTPEPVTALIGKDACIGNWGPHYPRQMRTRGPNQLLSSAIAAYRAMSVARTETQTFPFPVDTLGKIQLAYPKVSACVRVGKLPLPNDMSPSTDGAMGWIYWRPVTCCIPFDVISNCM